MDIKSHLILSFTSLLIACSAPTPIEHDPSLEDDTINYIQKEINLNGEEFEEKEDDVLTELAVYKDSWFEIQYPINFTAYPNEPIDKFENYEFVKTDEAHFLSANGSVEFFVYSPQWGGNPLSYLIKADNEEIENEKTTVDDIDSDIVLKWVTIKNKEGKYTRSYYSKQTESTHLVFGIKYKDQTSYDLFKEDYKAFKKSLIQYAD